MLIPPRTIIPLVDALLSDQNQLLLLNKSLSRRTFPGCPWPVDDVRHSTAFPYCSASPAITRVKPCHLLVSSASLEHLRDGREKFY